MIDVLVVLFVLFVLGGSSLTQQRLRPSEIIGRQRRRRRQIHIVRLIICGDAIVSGPEARTQIQQYPIGTERPARD